MESPAVMDRLDGPFDAVILSDTIGCLDDLQGTLQRIHDICDQETWVIIAHYSPAWRPILRIGEQLGMKMPEPEAENWLSSDDIAALLELANFEVAKREWRMLAAFTEQDVVSLDIILMAPWLNLVADAQRLPFHDASFSKIVMLDVLHHLPRSADFFPEAIRLLRPGGRLVMIEPAITPGSWPFLHFAHPDPVDLPADPLDPTPENESRDNSHPAVQTEGPSTDLREAVA